VDDLCGTRTSTITNAGFRSPRSAHTAPATSHSPAAAGAATIEPESSHVLQPADGRAIVIEFAAEVVTLPPKLIALANRHS
jgi:hypothetical protein